MSSHDKDPLDPSQSSESHSDSEVEKAEEDLDHLKIEDRLTKEEAKDVSDDSKPLDSPNRKGTSTTDAAPLNKPIAGHKSASRLKKKSRPDQISEKPHRTQHDSGGCPSKSGNLDDIKKSDPQGTLTTDVALLNEPIAGPSGFQGRLLTSSKVKSKSPLPDPRENKNEGVGENAEAKMMEADSSSTSSTSPFILSSTGLTPIQPPSIPERKHYHRDLERLKPNLDCSKSNSSRLGEFASSSANTSADVSEIHSEYVDFSTEGSPYTDANDVLPKEQSPGTFVTALERQSSDASESNISEIQDEVVPPLTPTDSSTSSSTPSDQQGHRAYVAQLQREAEARGVQISTSSGIGSTNQSELAHLQNWGLVGEMGSYRRSVVAEQLQRITESNENESLSDQVVQDTALLEQRREENEASEMPEGAMNAQDEDKVTVSSVEAVPPSIRRKPSKPLSDSSSSERGNARKLRERTNEDKNKKIKMVSKKSRVASQHSSESTEPKSSSSDEVYRKESPEIKSSSSDSKVESSNSMKSRKPWQRPGLLKRQSAFSSKDSVITEEEEQTFSGAPSSELMDSTTVSPENMDITPEEAALSESKFSVPDSSDQAYVSEADKTLIEQESSFEDPKGERSGGKPKRHQKMSASPPSDEGHSPDAKSTNHPKKKSRPDEIGEKPRSTRLDSGGSLPKSGGLDDVKEGDPESPPVQSDYTPSDEEMETAF